MSSIFLSLWIKLFFVFTPFFCLSMFLTITENSTEAQRHALAMRVSLAVFIVCMVLFFVGQQLFDLFGITLNAFRIGAGILLLLSAINLVQGKPSNVPSIKDLEDVAVVPLAVPVIVGPATVGTLLVHGADLVSAMQKIAGCAALCAAVLCMLALLLLASAIQRAIGIRGITILSKITGLILSALSAQMIMTGVQAFLK
ncbi:MAG: NAAT family transporter [Clostridia bacterium]|nr:NAAT family transporter [Clostridia bacterium]